MNKTDTVVHGLSIFKIEDGLYKLRSTIRAGHVAPEQILHFSDSEGNAYTLRVKECLDGPSRHTTIIVTGDAGAITNFKGGYYLYGE